jgi:5-methylthioadenosine/S-adenosylhomocysteine deaminase
MFAAGQYLWVRFDHIQSIEMEAPKRLRDLLWIPALVRTGPAFRGKELGEVLLPVLAPLSFRENDDAVKQRGKTPTETLSSLGMFTGTTLVAHGVWVNDSDLSLLKTYHVGVAHCPSSNMKLASGIAPVVKMLKMGIAVGLGTDGVAGSNNDHDMMEEMDLAAKLQKVATGDPSVLPAEQALAMATILGAGALRMDNLIGSIEEGKLADIISVRVEAPHAVPLYNVYSQLVYALKASDIGEVMVNGKMIVRNKRMLTVDDRTVMAKATEYQQRVSQSLKTK